MRKFITHFNVARVNVEIPLSNGHMYTYGQKFQEIADNFCKLIWIISRSGILLPVFLERLSNLLTSFLGELQDLSKKIQTGKLTERQILERYSQKEDLVWDPFKNFINTLDLDVLDQK